MPFNAGVPQQFIRFGTRAHRVLTYTQKRQQCTLRDIVRLKIYTSKSNAGLALRLLHKHKFLVRIGQTPYYPGVRTQWIYGIWGQNVKRDLLTKKEVAPTKVRSTALRTKRRRASSVFDLPLKQTVRLKG